MTREHTGLAHEFLLKEYENAAQVTFHADEFRDKLSTFFMTFAGAAVALVSLILQGTFTQEIFGDKNLTAALFLAGVSIIGFLILCVHARLRRVQKEYFTIINRIRVYCFQNDLKLWNTIRLSKLTLPCRKRRSGNERQKGTEAVSFRQRMKDAFTWPGSELWALTILLPTAVLFAAGIDFFLRWLSLGGWSHLISVSAGALIAWALWCLYGKCAHFSGHEKIDLTKAEEWLDEEQVRLCWDTRIDPLVLCKGYTITLTSARPVWLRSLLFMNNCCLPWGLRAGSMWRDGCNLKRRMGKLRRFSGLRSHRGMWPTKTGSHFGWRRIRTWIGSRRWRCERGPGQWKGPCRMSRGTTRSFLRIPVATGWRFVTASGFKNNCQGAAPKGTESRTNYCMRVSSVHHFQLPQGMQKS
jgi:hypothetical protein